MQYAVAQFVDVESKILGPISVRQFIEVAIAIGLLFSIYKFADLGLFILSAIFIVTLTVVVAFVKINGRPFHYFLLNLIQSSKNPRLRVWKKEAHREPSTSGKKKITKKEAAMQVNYVQVAREKEKARSRLSDLSLLVDTGGYYEERFKE